MPSLDLRELAWPWTTLALATVNGLRYLLLAGLAWWLVRRYGRTRWRHRKIVPGQPSRADVQREIRWSLVTLLVFGAVGATTLAAARAGWTRLYWRVEEHGWPWFVASIALAVAVHDTWFYWSHRLLHHRLLFRRWHGLHHRSRDPSPWAAYAFSPLEALVQAAIFPLVVALLPIHPGAFSLFMLWQLLFNVLGHCGYEIWPRWLLDSWLGVLLNTPTNHAMHHQTLRGNFGLYSNVWDRLCGTNHPLYAARFRALTAPPPAGDGAST